MTDEELELLLKSVDECRQGDEPIAGFVLSIALTLWDLLERKGILTQEDNKELITLMHKLYNKQGEETRV